MESKVKVIINGKDTIERIAADPDCRIRIKDALVDQVAKRALKAINAELAGVIHDAADEVVQKMTNPEEDNGLFVRRKNTYWPELSDDLIAKIKEAVRKEVFFTVREAIEQSDVFKEYHEVLKDRTDYLRKYDYDAAIKKEISKKIKIVFSGVFDKEVEK